jgi:hypothetical protein
VADLGAEIKREVEVQRHERRRFARRYADRAELESSASLCRSRSPARASRA